MPFQSSTPTVSEHWMNNHWNEFRIYVPLNIKMVCCNDVVLLVLITYETTNYTVTCNLVLTNTTQCKGQKKLITSVIGWHITTTTLQQFYGPLDFARLPRWAGNGKAKTNLDLLEQEIVSGSGISQTICKSAPRPRRVTMPASHHILANWENCKTISVSHIKSPWHCITNSLHGSLIRKHAVSWKMSSWTWSVQMHGHCWILAAESLETIQKRRTVQFLTDWHVSTSNIVHDDIRYKTKYT